MLKATDITRKIMAQQGKHLKHPAIKPETCDENVIQEAIFYLGQDITRDFIFDDDNLFAYNNLIYWFMGDPRMEAINPYDGSIVPGRLNSGIYLAGGVGTGKTVAMSILRKLYPLNPHQICNEDESRSNLVWWRESRADEIGDSFIHSGSLDEIKNAPLLCIQDLGIETDESSYMGNRIRAVRHIIEYRGDKPNLITMFTSNLPLGHPDLVKKYGDRAASRLHEMCNYLILKGKDRRKHYTYEDNESE